MYEATLDTNGEKVIDLRSDTLTKPNAAMRTALEAKCAKLFGTEAALFVTSGAMGNLISILVHCDSRGSEIIIGDQSHIHKYEQGSYAQFGGVSATILPNEPDGSIDLNMIEDAIRNHHDVHQPETRLICLENTQNRCGGRILPLKYLENVKRLAEKYSLKVHMDGARLMNAAVASEVPVNEIVKYLDSVTMCLSKGVGAPVGSVLGGTKEFIKRYFCGNSPRVIKIAAHARRMRKALGGGWRQAGVLAAAGIVGLNSAPTHMLKDHRNAQKLAEGIKHLNSPICSVVNIVETNIVQLQSTKTKQIVEMMLKNTTEWPVVAMLSPGENLIRIVTHWNISEEDIDCVIKKFAHVLKILASE